MIIMALDHARDYFSNLRFEPETLAQTYYALFLTLDYSFLRALVFLSGGHRCLLLRQA